MLKGSIDSLWIITRREFSSYFVTPIAYVFILIFLVLSGVFTFYLGNFYERGQADLTPFFSFHPWLYLFLVPAVSMRLWSEERKSGSIELLMTLPITRFEAVVGKFLAAWIFCTARWKSQVPRRIRTYVAIAIRSFKGGFGIVIKTFVV